MRKMYKRDVRTIIVVVVFNELSAYKQLIDLNFLNYSHRL